MKRLTMSNPLKEYFDGIDTAARNKRPIPVPAAITDPKATPEAKAAAESEYMTRLLAKSSVNYTAAEQEFLYRHLAEYNGQQS
jgi:hypothetical protein